MTYDQASNIVKKNSNSYSYDAVNQLVGASESGWFQKKPSDIHPEYTTAPRDYQGTAVLSFTSPVTTTIGLDTASQSVGIDLGPHAPYGVNRIELHPQTPSPRVGLHDDLSVYILPSPKYRLH